MLSVCPADALPIKNDFCTKQGSPCTVAVYSSWQGEEGAAELCGQVRAGAALRCLCQRPVKQNRENRQLQGPAPAACNSNLAENSDLVGRDSWKSLKMIKCTKFFPEISVVFFFF